MRFDGAHRVLDPHVFAECVRMADGEVRRFALQADAQALGRGFLGAPQAQDALVKRGTGQAVDQRLFVRGLVQTEK